MRARPAIWDGFTAYPQTRELMAAWQSSGSLKPFEDQGVSLTEKGQTKVAANRQFNRTLYVTVRSFESSPGARLEVWACVADNPSMDPLRLEVTSVRRSYGGLEFDGVLKSQSVLVPQLREGLPMRFAGRRIQASRLNDEPPVFLRPNR